MNLEQMILTIIANAGESRSDSLEAIESAKQKNFEDAEALLEKAAQELLIAHTTHTEILAESAKNEDFKVTFILMHASNHLSVAEVSLDMARNFVAILKEEKQNA